MAEEKQDVDGEALLQELNKRALNHWLKHIEARSGDLPAARQASSDKELLEETEVLLNGDLDKLSKGLLSDEELDKINDRATTIEKLTSHRYAAHFFWNSVKTHVKNFYNPDSSISDDPSHLVSTNPFADDTKKIDHKPKLPFNNRTLAYREDPLANKLVYPDSYEKIIEVMQEAIKRRMTIKPMGTQYAFNEITFTAGIQADIYKYIYQPKLDDKMEEERKNNLLNDHGKSLLDKGNMIISEAGTTTDMIHRETWPKPEDGIRRKTKNENGEPYKMLPYMPGFHMLTIGGTVQVGAEGQGRLTAAVQNQVLSIHMLTFEKDDETGKPRVQAVQIEKSVESGESIHDKDAWAKYYESKSRKVKLIQDDEVFNSAVCCVGTFGIVYSYHLKLVDAVNVVQHRMLINWYDYKLYYPLIRKWEEMNIHREDGSIIPGMLYDSNIYISPYEGAELSKLVSESKSEKIRNWDGKKIPVILTMNITTDEDVTESPYTKISKEGEPAKYRGGVAYGDQNLAYTMAMAMVWLSQRPLLNRFLGPCMYLALLEEKHDPLVMTCLDAFLLGASSCVPVNVAGMVVVRHKIIEAIEEWITLFNKTDNFGNYKHRCTSPCGVTWCNRANGYISMTGDEPRAWMEMPYCDYTYKVREIGHTYQMIKSMDATYEILQKEPYWGRFHLGLYAKFNEGVWLNTNLYPKFRIFLQNYKRFNYFGFFRNKFTIESGLDDLAGMPKYGSEKDWIKCFGLDESYNQLDVNPFSASEQPQIDQFDDTTQWQNCCDNLFVGCVRNYCKPKKPNCCSDCCYDFLNYFATFFEDETKYAGWRFFILGVIASSIGWFIGLDAIGLPLSGAFWPMDQTKFYEKLCCDEHGGKDNIDSSDIWEYASIDMAQYIFAGIFLHIGSAWVLSRHFVYFKISHPWWWLLTGLMWPLAVLFADVITVGMAGPRVVQNYLANLFITTVFRGLFIGFAQWPVLYFMLKEPKVTPTVVKELDPERRIHKWFHETVFGLWWIPQSILAWGIQLPAGVNFFFFALAIPPYKLPPLIVGIAIVAAVVVLIVTVLGGAYGNTGFCGKC